MVSPELLRRYRFFGGLDHEQLVTLSSLGSEANVAAGHVFFEEGHELPAFYLVVEGAVAILIDVPDQGVEHAISGQLTGDLQTVGVTVSTAGTGDVFGWSALLPPYVATASAQAIMTTRVIAFETKSLLELFADDCEFGYLMVQKAGQIVRDRLRDLRVESLDALAART